MLHHPLHIRRALSLAVLVAVVSLAVATTVEPAHAQVVAVVNGEPITQHDVANRIRLTQVLARKTQSRSEAVEELIDEQLKIREAKRWGALPSDHETDRMFASTASRAGMTADQFTAALKAQGVDPRGFKTRMRADFAWAQIVRGRYQAATQVGERDVSVAITNSNKGEGDGKSGVEYKLRQIVFVVPRGSGEAVVEQRRRDAEAFRGRFQSCDEGLRLARTMREVIVREPITRSSTEMTPKLRELLAATQDGRLTAPERTDSGVELVAVCGRRELVGESNSRSDLKQEIVAERIRVHSKRYLDDLRRAALIERRG